MAHPDPAPHRQPAAHPSDPAALSAAPPAERPSRRTILRRGAQLAAALAGYLGAFGAFGRFAPRAEVRAQITPAEQDAIACLETGDTQCAVDVLEAAFEARPFDDSVRESLFVTLIVHGLRCLDRGRLTEATAATERATHLIPRDPRLTYLADATTTFTEVLITSGAYARFSVVNTPEFESRLVDVDGMFGEPVSAIALTAKNPGNFNYLYLTRTTYSDTDLAARMLVYPTSTTGNIHLVFGERANGSRYSFMVDLAAGTWTLAQYDASIDDWITYIDHQYIPFSLNQWHQLEVRTRGQTVHLFIDYTEVGSQTLFDYEPGFLGFGVGLGEFASRAVFSAAFMDIALYGMSD